VCSSSCASRSAPQGASAPLVNFAAQAAKIDALKTHKKGLMQQLFPSPEEVEA